MNSLQSWGPLLVTIGAMNGLVAIVGRGSRAVRGLAALAAIGLALRYIWWRYTLSLPDPAEQNLPQQIWTWLFLITETAAGMTSIAMLAWMSRWRSRSEEADRCPNSPLLVAPVDVFIATYNEPFDILERTIVSATCIQHPDLRVWVLDDGARHWVRELADELGVHYICRVKGLHAKAGNINNGLAHALSTGRRPEFILLLDADFTVSRNILQRTLGLLEAEDVAIVQTPQHFFNPDPIQSSLLGVTTWPDEQRFFFNYLLEAKDAWGAAFCCGTSAVVRVSALEAIGGMATETVTEDMLTTFKLEELGYRTIFLNEQLSLGLAPEGLQEYIQQRSRWCLGAIQQLYTRWSFVGSAHIGFISRLSSLDAAAYWMFTFPFKLMLITAPLVFWWTGTAVVNADLQDIVYWLAPAVVASLAFMAIYGGNRVMPVMTDVSQLLSAFAIIGTVAVGLAKPWGHPFDVTAKGRSTNGFTVHWGIAAPFLFMAVATVLGMLINLSPYSPVKSASGYTLNVVWSLISVAVLLLTLHICIEPPKRRRDERFASGERGVLATQDGKRLNCVVRDLSVGGAHLECSAGWSGVMAGRLTFSVDGATVGVRTVKIRTDRITVQFDQDTATRRLMTAKLFTGSYHSEIRHVSPWNVLCATARAMFS
jgi:cellulose synthase (UDP-forming)